MDVHSLLSQLNDQPPGCLPPGEIGARLIQPNVFEVQAGGQPFFVKWIADENSHGQNELRIARAFAHLKTIPAPHLLFEQHLAGGTLAGWEWVQGTDLRTNGREHLPAAFACLGKLHRTLRNTNKVSAPLGNTRYPTLHAMLTAEIYRLTAPFDLPVRVRCLAVLAHLEAGYPTLIHGDMHPGNLIMRSDNIWIVDWSYARNSLNLFDLDYILSEPLPGTGPLLTGPDWSVISPGEAGEILKAYFEAAGLGHLDFKSTHQAVMVWNLLRSYENARLNGYRAEAQQTREQLLYLLKLS